MKPVIIIVIAFVFLFIPSNVYAEIIYPSITSRVDEPPSYCFVTPTDTSDIPRYEIQKWDVEIEEAVNDWNTKLRNAESGNKALWNLTYLGSDDAPLNNCDYPIYVKPYSNSPSLWFNSLGVFLYTAIHVFFLGWSSCETGGEYDYCYNLNRIRPPSEIGGTTRHEIGHSLGLGHYSSDNVNTISKWLKQNNLPSIMVGGLGTDKDWRIITNIDVQKVRSLYGDQGFYAFSTGAVPTPQPSIPTPTPIPISPIIPVFPFESVSVSSPVVFVERSITKYVKVIGDIRENIFKKGHNVFLTITAPDLTEELLRITTTSKGHFETTLAFDYNDKRGFYIVSAIYLEHNDRNKDVVIEVLSQGQQSQQLIQPNTSQTFGVSSEDPDGDGIIVNDWCPDEAETYNGYQDTDGCPDQNPSSKQTEKEKKEQEKIDQLKVLEDFIAKQEQKEREDQKRELSNEVIGLQQESYQKLENLKNGVNTAEASLKQTSPSSAEQREAIDKAWDLLKNSQSSLNKIEEDYQKGDRQLGYEYYENAKTWYVGNEKNTQKVGDNLKEISKLIEEAKPKFCFLFWCW